MENQYKDIRSIRKWLKRKSALAINDKKVMFYTLRSLTTDGIAKAIRTYSSDPNDPNQEKWITKYYNENPFFLMLDEDADDVSLKAIILFVIDHIIKSTIFRKEPYDKEIQGVSIPVKYLREHVYNDGKRIGHALMVCQAARFISKVSDSDSLYNILEKLIDPPEYIPIKQARSFIIHPDHYRDSSNTIEIIECPDPKLTKKILKSRKKEDSIKKKFNIIGQKDVHIISFYNLSCLKPDYDACVERLESELASKIKAGERVSANRLWHLYSMFSLKQMQSSNVADKFLVTDDSGRIHHNLTNFPSILRKHLSFKGCTEPMAMVDMSNAQPFLLVFLIMMHFSNITGRKIETRSSLQKYCIKKSHPDVLNYINVVENGDFYNECYRLFKNNKRLTVITPKWKEDIRQMIYTSLFYGDGKTKWRAAKKLRTLFSNEFPTVYDVILEYKKENYKNLSFLLQKEESKLFIDNVLTKLIVKEKRPYILSLHDGIFCPESAVDAVMSKFKDSFSKSQFQVRFKIEHYNTGKKEFRTI